MDSLIAQQLQQAELDVARMATQSAQEAAMVEVLPKRFSANIAAFSEHMPAIAAQFIEYVPARSFEFFCGENGIPNLRWCDDGSSFYGVDPFVDCSEQIDSVLKNASLDAAAKKTVHNLFNSIHVSAMNKLIELDRSLKSNFGEVSPQSDLTSMPLGLCFGIGLGYHLGFLFERCEVANLFLFEPDLDLFYASLYCFDWSSLLVYLIEQSKGLHLFLGQDESNVIEDLKQCINKYGAYLVPSSIGFWHYISPAISSLIETISKELSLLLSGWGFFDDTLFALSHGCCNLFAGIPFLKRDKQIPRKYRQLPVFVVGNGPSLDASLPYLKDCQHHGLVVACGSSIATLHRAGIKPDIYVAVERMQVMSNFLTVLNDPDYLKDILFLSVDIIHPNHHKIFNKIGLCLKRDEGLTALFSTHFPNLLDHYATITGVNPMAGNIGLAMPLTLGFRQIYLIGIDNGYRDNSYHHSKESAYYDDDGKQIAVLSGAARATHRLSANFGGEVLSNEFFAASSDMMRYVLSTVPSAQCYNCADGAFIKGAQPLPLENMMIPNIVLDKSKITDEIYQLFSPISIDELKLESGLDVESYNTFIDNISAQWEVIPDNRAGWLVRMQEQYNQLKRLSECNPLHYRVLFGSVNYIFSLLTRMVHRYPTDHYEMNEMMEAVAILRAFLTETKLRYRKGFSWIDETEDNAIRYYRKSTKVWGNEPVNKSV